MGNYGPCRRHFTRSSTQYTPSFIPCKTHLFRILLRQKKRIKKVSAGKLVFQADTCFLQGLHNGVTKMVPGTGLDARANARSVPEQSEGSPQVVSSPILALHYGKLWALPTSLHSVEYTVHSLVHSLQNPSFPHIAAPKKTDKKSISGKTGFPS